MEKCLRKYRESILEYIRYEIASTNYSDYNIANLETAFQCLETSWGIKVNKKTDTNLKLFNRINEQHDITEEEKKTDEMLKSQGNICMSENQFEDTVSCNRAEAYSKLNKNEKAIEDRKKVLTIDPKYSELFSKMDMGLAEMNKFADVIQDCMDTLGIDPDNENFNERVKEDDDGTLICSDPAILSMGLKMFCNPDIRDSMLQSLQAPSTSNSNDGSTLNTFISAFTQLTQSFQTLNTSGSNDGSTHDLSLNTWISAMIQFTQWLQAPNTSDSNDGSTQDLSLNTWISAMAQFIQSFQAPNISDSNDGSTQELAMSTWMSLMAQFQQALQAPKTSGSNDGSTQDLSLNTWISAAAAYGKLNKNEKAIEDCNNGDNATPDVISTFCNPAMMKMGLKMICNTDIRNSFTQLIQSFQAPNASDSNDGSNKWISAGQQWAEQLRTNDPDLLNYIMQQCQTMLFDTNPDNANPDNDNPGPTT